MAQYPQGIFQSLQWLLKKVKILALDKQPTFSISTASAAYTIVGRGVYEITTASASNDLIFPDPALMNGMSITIINSDAATAQAVSATNRPYSKGTSTQLSSFALGTYYQFVSINSKWRGGVLS